MLLCRQCYCFCYIFGWIFPSFPIPMSFFSADLFEPHAPPPPPPPLIHATKIEALQTCICQKKRKRTANYGQVDFIPMRSSAVWRKSSMNQYFKPCAGIFKQSMGPRNRVGIGLSYRPGRAGILNFYGAQKSIPRNLPRNRFRQPMEPGGPVRPYDNPIPTRFLAPKDCFKIPAQATHTAWWNFFHEIDSWPPYKFKNSGSANDPIVGNTSN
jgi:hypothetical protein